MLISVSSISSETVIIFELPWKPRCVMIMSVNSSMLVQKETVHRTNQLTFAGQDMGFENDLSIYFISYLRK